MAKRTLNIEDALQWAWRDMNVEGEMASGPGEEPARFSSTWGAAEQLLLLGTFVDTSPYRRDPDPPDEQGRVRDALTLAGAVAGLDSGLGLGAFEGEGWQWYGLMWREWLPTLLGREGVLSERDIIRLPHHISATDLVRYAARRACRPDWHPEGFRTRPKYENGEVVVDIEVVKARRADGSVVKHKIASMPLLRTDLTLLVTDRMRYVLWVRALEAVAAEVKGKLETLDVVGPGIALAPWAKEQQNALDVIEAPIDVWVEEENGDGGENSEAPQRPS